MMLTSRLLTGAATALALITPAYAETLMVTSTLAAGPGSLQAALEEAGASAEPTVIMITERDAEIETPTGLTYQGPSPVTIYGNGATLRSDANVTLLTLTDATAITLVDMDVAGPGGFNVSARGDAAGAAGRGIFYDVAAQAQGGIGLRLVNVSVSGVAGHGIFISDCAQVEDCTGDAEGAPASIVVELSNVSITDVGQGRFDADGLHVDERGAGDITLTGMYVDVFGVGGDGIELDEGGNGDVIVDLIHSNFIENGSYCDPAILEAFLPAERADTFREAQRVLADIPQLAPETPDLDCFELELDLYDDNSVESYTYWIDVDDGLDIDEAGPGSVIASISVGEAVGNFDTGYDIDERGRGDMDIVLTGIIGNGNLETAVALSEDGPGSLFMTATALEASSNGDVGVYVEEEDGGDLTVALVGSATSGNDGGDLGIEAEQSGDGEGNVYVIDSEIADGIETDGVTLDAD